MTVWVKQKRYVERENCVPPAVRDLHKPSSCWEKLAGRVWAVTRARIMSGAEGDLGRGLVCS